jgi:YebC/PmpR family DNA-binding regulatory protein
VAGHSKWSNIKRKKGVVDAKRGKLFTKLIREVQVAARMGGSDVSANPRLREGIAECKANNLPKENIERAIKRGTGELEGSEYVEITYEGYGPGGTAILIESLTDNRNRTVSDLRATMVRNHGNLGELGSVAWIFDKKGVITIKKQMAPEEKLMEMALEAGAEDIRDEGEYWEIITDPSQLMAVKDAIEGHGLVTESAIMSAIPKTTVHLQGEDAAKMLKLMDVLEDIDDVQRVHANFDIDEKELEQLGAL